MNIKGRKDVLYFKIESFYYSQKKHTTENYWMLRSLSYKLTMAKQIILCIGETICPGK